MDDDTTHASAVSPARIFSAMFLLGVFSTLAQVIFLREMMVVFFGNELVIGTLLAGWLLGISLGACAARLVPRSLGGSSFRWLVDWLSADRVISVILLLMALLLPFQIYCVRVIRVLLDIPVGEYASFRDILVSSFLIFSPTCVGIGFVFPLASDLVSVPDDSPDSVSAVSRIYAWESLGSMLGGVALTAVLLRFFEPYRIVFVAMSLCAAAAAVITPCRGLRVAPAFLAVCAALLPPIYPRLVDMVERRTVEAEWRASGVLGSRESLQAGRSATRLECSTNSIYQNLAITESEGQYALYANGRVMFVFPDPIGTEHSIHFIMAQKPTARRILLIGGNPVGDIPELLKYPVERLVHVELDPAVGRMISRIRPGVWAAVSKEPRVTLVSEDAPGFMRRCREQFDVILIHAPEPVTAAANRFYTLEFYRHARRCLAADGFLYTSLNSSERLQSETADLGASVYMTLKSVFPVLRVTAESQNRFFAGNPESGLTFDRQTLCERSEKAGVKTLFFKPQYFLGADELEPGKLGFVEKRFNVPGASLNTNLKPVTYFYNLMLWGKYSGSGSFPGNIRSIDLRRLVVWVLGCGLVMFLAGVGIRVYSGFRALPGANVYSMMMGSVVIGTTGFCGMALELMLIYVVQGLYGYVYSMMGLIVAVFMLGLVLGAPSGRWMAGKNGVAFWFFIALIELLLAGFALALPGVSAMVDGAEPFGRVLEVFLYLSMGFIGWAVGAEFSLVNRLLRQTGASVRASAAVTDAADHFGAAGGALLVGVVLVPVLGIGASCGVIAAIKVAGLLCLGGAVVKKF